MIAQLNELRHILSSVMIQCLHRRVVLFGNGRSGQFIKWYAKYYHNISVDFEIACEDSLAIHDWPILAPQLFDFNYKDVSKCVLWITEPLQPELEQNLQALGYVKNVDYFDFYWLVYQGDYCSAEQQHGNMYSKKKSGKRDIQFMEWLEWKYDCNLLTAIWKLPNNPGTHYCISTQKEIFPILDLCHFDIGACNAAFDYGCGKGGPMLSFLDYGFSKVGGVEYDENLYSVVKENFRKLDLEAEIIRGDAAEVTDALDSYNLFYFYHPFYEDTYKKCIDNIVASINRKRRLVRLILFIPYGYKYVETCGHFKLVAQTMTSTWLKVVNIYESIS